MENVDDASWADTGFSTSVPSPSKLLETEASCVCNSCFQAYPQSIFYHCNICCAQDGGRYVCSLCLRKAIWCGDRSHILTAVSKPTSTLRWRPSHHLVVIPQAHGEPEPERLFYERLDAVVASEPHLVPRTTQLIWFLNEALVLIYDYETKHRTICSIYNHAPWGKLDRTPKEPKDYTNTKLIRFNFRHFCFRISGPRICGGHWPAHIRRSERQFMLSCMGSSILTN